MAKVDALEFFQDRNYYARANARIAALEAKLAEALDDNASLDVHLTDAMHVADWGKAEVDKLRARLAEAEKREERAYRAGYRQAFDTDAHPMEPAYEKRRQRDWLAYKAGRGGGS